MENKTTESDATTMVADSVRAGLKVFIDFISIKAAVVVAGQGGRDWRGARHEWEVRTWWEQMCVGHG